MKRLCTLLLEIQRALLWRRKCRLKLLTEFFGQDAISYFDDKILKIFVKKVYFMYYAMKRENFMANFSS